MRALVSPLLAAAAMMAAWPAAAENRAVAVVERNYDKFGPAAAPDAEALFSTLRGSGMRVASGIDLDMRDLRQALDDLSRPDPQPGARIVVLTGKFVRSASDTWLLASDAAAPTLGTVDLYGMSLTSILDLMRDGGSRSVLLLGADPGGVNPGTRMEDGIGTIGQTGGVQVILGTPEAVVRAAAALSRAGTTVASALATDPSLRLVAGSGGDVAPLAASLPVVVDPAHPGQPVVAGAGAPAEPGRVLEGEAEAWVIAAARHSAASYAAFVEEFPEGRYATVARDRLAQLGGDQSGSGQSALDGDLSPPLVELQLNLSSGRREQVQRDLTLLNYDTNGVDGIIGKGTRAALKRWQQDSGRPATGYLDAGALERLRTQASGLARTGAGTKRGIAD